MHIFYTQNQLINVLSRNYLCWNYPVPNVPISRYEDYSWRPLWLPSRPRLFSCKKNGGARTIFQYLPVKWREPSINQWETDFCTSWGFRVLCEALKMSVGVTYRMGGSSHHGVTKLVGWRIMHVLIMAPIWWISKSWRHPFKIITHTHTYIYIYTVYV